MGRRVGWSELDLIFVFPGLQVGVSRVFWGSLREKERKEATGSCGAGARRDGGMGPGPLH